MVHESRPLQNENFHQEMLQTRSHHDFLRSSEQSSHSRGSWLQNNVYGISNEIFDSKLKTFSGNFTNNDHLKECLYSRQTKCRYHKLHTRNICPRYFFRQFFENHFLNLWPLTDSIDIHITHLWNKCCHDTDAYHDILALKWGMI